MLAWSYIYITKSQLWWMYKHVRDNNKQNLLSSSTIKKFSRADFRVWVQSLTEVCDNSRD